MTLHDHAVGHAAVKLSAARCAIVTMLMAPVVLHIPVHEFVTLQRLPEDQLRDRLGLPVHCDPSLTAIGTRRSRILVVITCQGDVEDGTRRTVAQPP